MHNILVEVLVTEVEISQGLQLRYGICSLWGILQIRTTVCLFKTRLIFLFVCNVSCYGKYILTEVTPFVEWFLYIVFLVPQSLFPVNSVVCLLGF